MHALNMCFSVFYNQLVNVHMTTAAHISVSFSLLFYVAL